MTSTLPASATSIGRTLRHAIATVIGTRATRTSPYEQNAETASSTPPAADAISLRRFAFAGGNDHERGAPCRQSCVERVGAGGEPDRGGRDHEEWSRSTGELLTGDVSGCEEHRRYRERAADHEQTGSPIRPAETDVAEHGEEHDGSRRVPLDVNRIRADVLDETGQERTEVVHLRQRREVLAGAVVPVTRRRSTPRMEASATDQSTDPTADPSSSRGHRSDMATRGAYTTASPPIRTTSTTFMVTRGSKLACSGGTSTLIR